MSQRCTVEAANAVGRWNEGRVSFRKPLIFFFFSAYPLPVRCGHRRKRTFAVSTLIIFSLTTCSRCAIIATPSAYGFSGSKFFGAPG